MLSWGGGRAGQWRALCVWTHVTITHQLTPTAGDVAGAALMEQTPHSFLLSVCLLSTFYVSDTSRRGNSKGLSCPPEIMLLLNGRTGFKTQWTFNPKFELSTFALISCMSSSHHMVLSTFYRMMTSDLCLQFRPVSWSLDFSSQPPPYYLLWDVWEAFQT